MDVDGSGVDAGVQQGVQGAVDGAVGVHGECGDAQDTVGVGVGAGGFDIDDDVVAGGHGSSMTGRSDM